MTLTQTLTMPVFRHAETQHMNPVTLVSVVSWTPSDSCLHPPVVSCLKLEAARAELPSLFFHVPTVPDIWSIIMEMNILQPLFANT